MGGYKIQGRKSEDAARLLEDAVAVERAGAFSLVIECVPAVLGEEITRAVKIPTIGIGAGPGCDGQILVAHDMLGIESSVSPKFVKRYAQLGADMSRAFNAYRKEVENSEFPTPEQSY